MTATRANLKTCSNCKEALAAFVDQAARLTFCGADCANEHSAKQCSAIVTAEMVVLINQVRSYLAAVRVDRGSAVELGRLAHYASKLWPDLKDWPIPGAEQPAPAALAPEPAPELEFP